MDDRNSDQDCELETNIWLNGCMNLKNLNKEKIREFKCKKCKRIRALIDELCDDCTIKENNGNLFPWLK